jgi:hypothetical protein
MVDIAATQPCVIQTETDRMLGELVRVVYVRFLTVLDAVEPFLLGGGDERAVDDQRGGGLVIHRVDSENVHRPKTRDMRVSACLRSKDMALPVISLLLQGGSRAKAKTGGFDWPRLAWRQLCTAPNQKTPIDRPCQFHQRVVHVDDLIKP